MSCGCSGDAGTSTGASATRPRSVVKIALVLAVAWAVAKGQWGALVLIVGAALAYRIAAQPPGTAAAPVAPLQPPGSFTTGTDNVEGSAAPTTLVEGISPTVPGSC